MNIETLKKPENMIRMGKVLIVLSLACFIYSGVLYAIIDHGTGNISKLTSSLSNAIDDKAYTIIFKDGATSTYVKVRDGQKLEKQKNENEDFLGWYKDNELYDFNSEINSSFTLVARYKSDILYTVTFDSNGGSNVSSVKVVTGEKVKRPTAPTRTGYKFIRWTLNDQGYDFNAPVTKDITLVAVWEQKEKITITFDTDGGKEIDKIISYKDDKVGILPTPEKDGYIFDGWYEGEVKYTENAVLSEDVTLKAKWILKEEVTITFDTGISEQIENRVLYKGDKIGGLPVVKKDGYDFLGWYDESVKYTENTEVTKSVTLKAKWKLIEIENGEQNEEVKYTVMFDSNGGSSVSNKIVKENEKIGELPVTTKEGFIFKGWFLENEEYNENKIVTKDITLKAKWEKDEELQTESDIEKAKKLISDSYEITKAGEIIIESSVCTIELTNKNDIEKITRAETDTELNLVFKITCGYETDTKVAIGVIKKSPYTFGSVENSETGENVITINSQVNGKLYSMDGNLVGNVQNGSLTITEEVASKYVLKLFEDENTSYVVTGN